MRTIPAALQTHLEGDAHTMCYCWRITRKDGTVLGFTNHDNDLTFDSTTFEAATGFEASAIQQSLGLSVDNMELLSAFDSATITEEDLGAGKYDDAFLEMFWLNWQDVAQRIIVMNGYVGEIEENGIAFTAEFRSLSSRLNQKIGRVYQRTCDAVFGDERCKVNRASFTYAGTVAAVNTQRSISVSGAAVTALDNDYLSRGVLTWLTGNNAGVSYDVKVHSSGSPNHVLELWSPAAAEVQVGDTFNVVAGCKQTFDVCKSKFSNAVNFQGFPYMPGSDIVQTYPEQGGSNQSGGSLFNG
jgi:uncharacterized phage protein (TIGR02218 family)